MRFYIAIFFLQFFSISSMAFSSWQEKGNGGDVIVCANSKDNKMYDAYEAEVRHKLKMVFPVADSKVEIGDKYTGFEDIESIIRVARLIVDRIEKIDPELHTYLVNALLQFPREVRFVADSELVDVPDFGMGFIPKNCELKQLIVQRTPRFPEDRRYMVSLDYWETLSLYHKIVGVLHEVLYNYVRKLNPRIDTSEPIRYFNALLLSDSLKRMNADDYRELRYEIFLWIY